MIFHNGRAQAESQGMDACMNAPNFTLEKVISETQADGVLENYFRETLLQK
jgi:hypothetical protein